MACSKCAENAKKRAAAKAKLAAQSKTAPGSQYAKAVEKGQRAPDK